MGQVSDSKFKTVFLPKVRVTPDFERRCKLAYKAWEKRNKGESYAEWIRSTLEAAC